MFDLSLERLVVLMVIALFVLGPERLPEAARWLGQAVRKVKDFATNANQQLRNELGPQVEQFREPLEELRGPLRELRSLRDPRAAITRHLFADPPAPRAAAAGPVAAAGPAGSAGSGVRPPGGAPAGPAAAPRPGYEFDAT